MMLDIDRWLDAGHTGWDGYPDLRCGKMDAETCALEAAMARSARTLEAREAKVLSEDAIAKKKMDELKQNYPDV